MHPWLENYFHLTQLNTLLLTGRIDELSGGALLAYLVQARSGLSKRIFSPVTVIAAWSVVGALYALKTGDHFITGVAGVLTIGMLVDGSWPAWTAFFENCGLRFLGRISYALYLFHSPFFWYFHHRFSGVTAFFGVLLGAGLAIGLAWISTRWVKRRQF